MKSKQALIPVWSEDSTSLTRVSGHPIGLPQSEWPLCGCCGKALSFIAQIECKFLSDKALSDSHVMYIFMCRNFDSQDDCMSYVGIPSQSQQTHKIIITAPTSEDFSHPPHESTYHTPGLGLTSWKLSNEEYPEAIEDFYLKGLNESTRMEWPIEHGWAEYVNTSMNYFRHSKIGGLPCWIQEPFFNVSGEKEWTYSAQFSDANLIEDDYIWSTLDSGILFLINDKAGNYELFYQGR